jgi:hypothetical protein
MKRLGLFLLFIIAGSITGGMLAWNQATRLPSTTTATTADMKTSDVTTAAQNAAQVSQKLRQLQTPATTVILSQQEVSDVVTSTIDELSRQAHMPEAIRGVNTELIDGKLKAGAIIDLSKLPTTEQSGKSRNILTKVLQRLPGMGDRPIYVGIESTPKISNGQVQLDANTQFKVGAINLSLEDMAKYVGMTPAQLQADLNKALPIGDLPLDAVSITDRQLILQSPSAP